MSRARLTAMNILNLLSKTYLCNEYNSSIILQIDSILIYYGETNDWYLQFHSLTNQAENRRRA